MYNQESGMLKNKLIKCNNCNSVFDAGENRLFVFSKLASEDKHWPYPGFANIIKEGINYNLVKCPKCGNKFKTNRLKLLYVFSPLGLFVFIAIFKVFIALYFYVAFIKK
jgi:uncharacterized C2H2 Zn-finger protein